MVIQLVLLVIFSSIAFVSNSQWFDAVKTLNDVKEWFYPGVNWNSSVAFSDNDGELFDTFFDKHIVRVKVIMNDLEDIVVIFGDARGKTLHDLTTTDINTYYADPSVNDACVTVSPWGMPRILPEQFTCTFGTQSHRFVFNGDDFFGQLRLGMFSDSECVCTQAGSTEGVGLGVKPKFEGQASGRVQVSGSNPSFFFAATVQVFCAPPTPAPVAMTTGSGTGDPHFKSLDGLSFEYNGGCNYMLLTNGCGKEKDQEYPKFEMIGRHGKCSSFDKKNICITKLTINIWKKSNSVPVRIELESDDQMKIDNVDISLPYSDSLLNAKLEVHSTTHKRIRVFTNFGLRVWYADYGSGTLEVYLGDNKKTCGILGNNNKDKKDDLTMKNGKILPYSEELSLESIIKFGDSWMVSTPYQPLRCTLYPTSSYQSTKHCSFDQVSVEKSCEKMLKTQLKLLSGKAVAKCFSSSKLNEIDGKRIYDDCVTQICACKEKDANQCKPTVAMEEFQRVCVANDVPFPDIAWN